LKVSEKDTELLHLLEVLVLEQDKRAYCLTCRLFRRNALQNPIFQPEASKTAGAHNPRELNALRTQSHPENDNSKRGTRNAQKRIGMGCRQLVVTTDADKPTKMILYSKSGEQPENWII
jgi:hypothetical protein